MELQFLGTGAGMPSKQRNTSALVLKLMQERGTFWLFDCGEATQHQMLHTTLKPRKLEKIFITHMHGDHIFGLPGLLGSRSFMDGQEPLTIYGPIGIEEWITTTLRISRTVLQYKVNFVEIQEGIIFEDDQFTVEAKLLHHVIPCFGYRVLQNPLPPQLLIEKAVEMGVPKGPLLAKLKYGQDVVLENGQTVLSQDVTAGPVKGFSISILGDTRYCQASIELSRDVDIVIHEATFDAGTEELAKPYGHSTITQAAQVAKESGAKHLIVQHISARFLPSQAEELRKQGLSIFPSIQVAEDFAEYELKQDELKRIKNK
ncbi:ribonuclease Z [Paenisporosarcina quisquiliarum]|uniref:Ribonuclease Z n=1 Tax=Paenisporosarcina quisquiliarum TaxID=365346 RepID=A0A9X3REI0_9BACL|nr:ribonuclease Z [Paenisporosarcina quisquiliarum]MCZ8537989.1 ribonuclease Z [Paenisporosarcina quisquiliarum]